MNEIISPCYRCPFHTKPIIDAGNEKFVKAIHTFGDSVSDYPDLAVGSKDELIGILNAIVSSYNPSISVEVVFNSFSKIVLSYVIGIESLITLWDDVVQSFSKKTT